MTKKKKAPAKKKKKKKATQKKAQPDPTAPLVAAIREDRLDDLRALLAAGADPDALDAYEEWPLLFFALEAHPAAIPVLLEAGANPNTAARTGWTSLMFACAGVPDPEVVELLLARGADARVTDRDGTALTRALDSAELTERVLTPGVERVVRALLNAGADPNAPREDGWTPLMLAAHSGSTDAVRALLAAGARVDATKGKGDERLDAVAIAAHQGHAAVTALLRDGGAADPAARTESEVRAAWEGVLAWLRTNAPAALTRLVPAGVTDAELARLEATLGAPLPDDLRAHLRLHGRSRGLCWLEYEVLTAEAIASTWRGHQELLEDGTFADGREPRELDRERSQVKFVWWSPGFVPVAQDGCGNLHCVDLDPDERGSRGQVIAWEVQSGPVGPFAESFLDHLRAYRKKLESGRYTYDADSGTFV